MKEAIVSSIKVDQEFCVDEVRRMTLDWGYAINSSTTRSEKKKRAEVDFSLPQVVKSFINFVSIAAGVATTVSIVAWLTGWITF